MSRENRRDWATSALHPAAAGIAVHPSDEIGAEGADMRRRG